jgi:hypothetical protein
MRNSLYSLLLLVVVLGGGGPLVEPSHAFARGNRTGDMTFEVAIGILDVIAGGDLSTAVPTKWDMVATVTLGSGQSKVMKFKVRYIDDKGEAKQAFEGLVDAELAKHRERSTAIRYTKLKQEKDYPRWFDENADKILELLDRAVQNGKLDSDSATAIKMIVRTAVAIKNQHEQG